jgi:inositol-phosphate phosphatase/L-galactose 1-phosphate phosphatase/histidinol-phosphatase
MDDAPKTFASFALSALVPAASEVLNGFYTKHCAGEDIGIETKENDTPASLADREAERVLRDLIQKAYPEHGIWGEEFGTHQIISEYIWVLDPLDGTREFLAKKPHHFGLLIGLLHNGKAVWGSIHDPLDGNTISGFTKEPNEIKELVNWAKTTISSTCLSMFEDLPQGEAALALLQEAQHFPGLNCMGFAQVASGKIDMVIESDLSLHDIAALIPTLSAHGVTCIDFTGKPYQDYVFTFEEGRKYNIIATKNKTLATQTLERINA